MNKIIAKLKDNKEYVIYFLVVLAICFMFPYSWDDWAWGSKIGIGRLKDWFDGYGGRYFGNIMALILTRSVILRSLCCATTLAGIVYILNKLTKGGRVGNYIAIISLLLMPITVLRESVVWAAGFSNYGISILLTLIYIYFFQNIYKEEKPNYPTYSIPIVLILGFLNTLIIEHLTLFNVVLSIYVIVFTYIKHRKFCAAHISYFIGCVAGTVWMFSNSAYSKFASGQDAERSISAKSGIIGRAVDNYFRDIALHGFLNNLVINAILLICMVALFKKIKSQLSNKNSIIGKTAIIIVVVQVALSVMHAIMQINSNEIGSHGFPTSLSTPITVLQYVQGITGILFMFAIIAFIAILPIDSIKRIKLLFIPISIGVMMAPLIVVVPIGGRCFFCTYVFFIWLIISFYKMLDTKLQEAVEKKTMYFRTVIVVALVFFVYIFGTICIADHKRIEKARADIAKGKKTIELKDLPYQQYIHGPNPIWDEKLEWQRRFKLFHHLKKDVYILNIHKYRFEIIEPETTTQKQK